MTTLAVQTLTIAHFRHKQDNRVRQHDCDWHELRGLLTRHVVRPQKDGALWSPTLYRPDTTRGNRNVVALCSLVLDFDHGVRPEEVTAEWERWEYALYSTHRHTPDEPRWRAVFPLREPVPAGEWARVWGKLTRHFGSSAADPACKEPARIYYLPSHPPGGAHFAELHEGEWLDPEEFPDPPPVETPRKSTTNGHTRAALPGTGDYRTLDIVALFRAHAQYGRPMSGGKHAVLCPWYMEHSEPDQQEAEDSDTVVWEAEGDQWPTFDCKHGHCQGRTMRDILAFWDADRFCAARFVPRPPRGLTDDDAPPAEEDGDEERDDDEGEDLLAEKPRGPSEQTLARHFAAHRCARLMYMDGDQWFFYQHSGAWARRNYEHVERLAYDWLVERQRVEKGTVTVSARKISALVKLAKNELGPHAVDELDARTDWIPLANGVYDLGADQLLPHLPGNRIGHILPYDYDPAALCTRWLQFLSEALVEEDGRTPCTAWHDLMQEFAGYLLIPTARAQTSMFWLGGGANGKGVAQKVFENLVGPRQVASILMSELHQPYHLAYLHGKLLATISEIDRQAMRKNGQMLKAIIGGDTISGRRPGENFFDFPPTVRVILTCNEMPRTDDQSEGYFRRILQLAFRRHFTEGERDPFLIEKLRGEASGIFNWALIGLRRLQARDFRFETPQASRDLLHAYRTSEDNLKRFVDERCERDVNGGVHTKPFYAEYCRYCTDGGEKDRILRLEEVRRRLEGMGFKQGRPYIDGISQRGFFGLSFKTEDWVPELS